MKFKRTLLKKISIKNNKKGFTLVEVILAILIFSILLLAIYPNFNIAVRTVEIARNKTTAGVKGTDDIKEDATDENLGEDAKNISYIGGTWLNNPNTDKESGAIRLIESDVNGTTVKYFYFVPYHPYRCGNDCTKCSKSTDYFD